MQFRGDRHLVTQQQIVGGFQDLRLMPVFSVKDACARAAGWHSLKINAKRQLLLQTQHRRKGASDDQVPAPGSRERRPQFSA